MIRCRGAALAALTLLSCQASLPALPDAGPAVDSGPLDTSHDALSPDRGAPPADFGPDLGADALPDAPAQAPGLFDCTAAEALTEPPIDAREPAASADGLTVYVRDLAAKTILAATRAALDQPLGAWQTAPSWLGAMQDYSFFRTDGGEDRFFAAAGYSAQGRYLVDCAVGASCDLASAKQTVTLPPGIDGPDIDGPDLAWVDGAPLLVFNAGPTADDHKALIAKLVGGVWTGEALPAVPDVKNDDPAISPDGLLVVFSAPVGARVDLWIVRRAILDQPFGQPEVLPAPISSSGKEHGPDLIQTTDPGRLELIFTSNRGGSSQLYRTSCATSADS